MVTFVVKSKVLSDGYLDNGYPDLSDGQSSSVFVRSGIRKSLAYSNFQISEKPPFGDARLVSAFLSYYIDVTTLQLNEDTTNTVSSGTDDGAFPINLYHTKNNIKDVFEEGSTVVANSDILTFTSNITPAPIIYDDFSGNTFYEEPTVSTRWTEGIKMRESGPSISVGEAYLAQKGGLYFADSKGVASASKQSKEGIYGAYAYKAVRIQDRKTLGENSGVGVGLGNFALDVLEGVGTPWLAKSKFAASGNVYAYDENARVPIKRMEGVLGNSTALAQTGTEMAAGFILKSAKKISDWWSGPDKGISADVGDISNVVRKKWKPKYGNQILQNDIWFYDDDIKNLIEYDKTDVIENIPQTAPLLKKPEPQMIISEKNSIWTNMRKTSPVEFRIESEGGEEDESSSDQRVFIAQSNSVFTQDSASITSCLWENIHAYFSNEQDNKALLKAPNSELNYLQEIRGQIYVPAPLDFYPNGDTQQRPNPVIHMPIRLELPPPFTSSSGDGGHSSRLTCRRAAWFLFNRYPISNTHDICSWWYNDKARMGAYGVVMMDGTNAHDASGVMDGYYIVADIHDLVNKDDIMTATSDTASVSDKEPILDLGPGIDELEAVSGTTWGGTSYTTDGIHRNVPLKPIFDESLTENGRGATADVTVSSGSVTDVKINKFGHYYNTSDILYGSGMAQTDATVAQSMHVELSNNAPATNGEILFTNGSANTTSENTVSNIARVYIRKDDEGGTDRATRINNYWKTGHVFKIRYDDNKYLIFRCTNNMLADGDNRYVNVELIKTTHSTLSAMFTDEVSVTLTFARYFTANPKTVTAGKDIKAFIPKDSITGDGNWADLKFHCTIDGIKMTLTNTIDNTPQSLLLNPKHSGKTLAEPEAGDTFEGPAGMQYISLCGHIRTHPTTLMSSYSDTAEPVYYEDNREWSLFRKYHIKSAFAGVQSGSGDSDKPDHNIWSKNNSPKGMNDGTAGTDVNGYNGITNGVDSSSGTIYRGPAASLTYMWSPYFTVSLTNTRYGGDNRGQTAINDNANLKDADSIPLDPISRLYMDHFTASRFNYTHQNATMSSSNIPSNNISISANDNNNFSYLKFDEHGQDRQHEAYGSNTGSSAKNQGFICLGFKNKTDAHASAKYFLMNGFFTSKYRPTMPITDLVSSSWEHFSYSTEMHPLGEFYPFMQDTYSSPTENNTGLDEEWYKHFTGTSEIGSYATGYPMLKNNPLFGVVRNHAWSATDDSGGNGSFNNTEALAATSDYLLTGNNYVEGFSQSGIFKLDWNDTTTSELATKLYLHGAASTENNMLNSVDSDAYKITITTDSTTNNFSSAGEAAWGLPQASRGTRYFQTGEDGATVTEGRASFVGPNLNTLLIWSDEADTIEANRGDMCTVHAMDNTHNFYISKTCSTLPTDDNRFFMSPGRFVRRENPMVQARILHAEPNDSEVDSDTSFKVMVDDNSILSCNDDEIYIIYHAGREWVTHDHLGAPTGGFHADANDMVRQNKYVATLCTAKASDDGGFILENYETITKTNPANVKCSDTGAGNLEDIIYNVNKSNTADNTGFSTANMVPEGRFINSTLCISPWRYWIYIQPQQMDDIERAYKSICEITSTVDSDFSEAAGNASCALKTSWNSSTRTDSHLNSSSWSWDFESTSQLELETDFGYGAYSYEDRTGGYLDTKLVQPGGYVEFNMSGLISSGAVQERDITTVAFLAPEEGLINNTLIIMDSDEGTNKPYLYSVFFDELPQPPQDFTVKPQEGKEFYPEFTWSNQSDDVWYGFLIIDDKPINNQYHGSVLHLPLNEKSTGVTSNSYYRPDQGEYYGTTDSNGNITRTGYVDAVGADVVADIEGLAGYTTHYSDSSNSHIKLNDGRYTQPTTEMSISLHVTPDNTPTADEYLIHKLYEYYIYLDSNRQIHAGIYPEADSDWLAVELKSTSSLTADGYTPTNIILTLDTRLKSGNVKLYIDGKLEDQSGLRKATGTKNNWPTGVSLENHTGDLYIGAKDVGISNFDGKLEELSIYNIILNPVTPKDESFIFKKPVKELTDSSEAVSRSYSGKLFIKDYHNIRGVSDRNVVSSPQVSFRKAAFRLRTEN